MIQTRIDSKRGCGWRKAGGTYLMGGRETVACGRLPIPLDRCPTCDHGVKPSRGWTWVNGDALLAPTKCPHAPCRMCLLGREELGRCGLLWVGEQHYATPQDFMDEAQRLGVSRKIPAVPNDFKLGETIVLMAHRKAIPNPITGVFRPGIFTVFRPTAIEYVTKGDETEEFLERLEARDITPVRIVRDEGGLPGILAPLVG